MDYGEPEPATLEQIAQVVKDFAASARAAVDAGADGVEIHAGNGYLLQQFMARKTNLRSDAYGGDVAGRCKLLLEVSQERGREEGGNAWVHPCVCKYTQGVPMLQDLSKHCTAHHQHCTSLCVQVYPEYTPIWATPEQALHCW